MGANYANLLLQVLSEFPNEGLPECVDLDDLEVLVDYHGCASLKRQISVVCLRGFVHFDNLDWSPLRQDLLSLNGKIESFLAAFSFFLSDSLIWYFLRFLVFLWGDLPGLDLDGFLLLAHWSDAVVFISWQRYFTSQRELEKIKNYVLNVVTWLVMCCNQLFSN